MKFSSLPLECGLEGTGRFRLRGLASLGGGSSLRFQPAGKDVHVVEGADLLLEQLEEGWSVGRPAAALQGIVDLGGVAEPPRLTPQGVKRLRVVAVAQASEAFEESLSLLFASSADAAEDREKAIRLPGQELSQIAAEARDLEVEEGLRHLGPAARAGRAEAAPQGQRLPRRNVLLAQVRIQEIEAHVEVAARPRRLGQIAENAQGALRALALGLLREQGDRHLKPPAGHAHVVNGHRVAGEALGEPLENRAHPLAEER